MTLAASACLAGSVLALGCGDYGNVPAGRVTAPASDPAGKPPGLVTVIFPSGESVSAEVADDPEERTLGLMFREELPEDRAMLLVFPAPAVQGIWMKNCRVALDILWLGEDGELLAVRESVPPCESDPCPVHQPPVAAQYVLELAAGVAGRHGLRVGSRLRIVSTAPLTAR